MSAKFKREKMKVIMDSNAFFVPLRFRIDIFEELKRLLKMNFEIVLLPQIKQELEEILEKSSSKMRMEAAYALKLAENCRTVDVNVNAEGSPDDIIVEVARKWKSPVFTNDKELRKRLRNISVPVIYVRQKSRLEIDGRI